MEFSRQNWLHTTQKVLIDIHTTREISLKNLSQGKQLPSHHMIGKLHLNSVT